MTLIGFFLSIYLGPETGWLFQSLFSWMTLIGEVEPRPLGSPKVSILVFLDDAHRL